MSRMFHTGTVASMIAINAEHVDIHLCHVYGLAKSGYGMANQKQMSVHKRILRSA